MIRAARLALGITLLAAGLMPPASAQLMTTFVGPGSTAGGGGAQPTGDILLVDGVSLLLQTDGASFVCLAGGC
jgi:hypothetical protein